MLTCRNCFPSQVCSCVLSISSQKMGHWSSIRLWVWSSVSNPKSKGWVSMLVECGYLWHCLYCLCSTASDTDSNPESPHSQNCSSRSSQLTEGLLWTKNRKVGLMLHAAFQLQQVLQPMLEGNMVRKYCDAWEYTFGRMSFGKRSAWVSLFG